MWRPCVRRPGARWCIEGCMSGLQKLSSRFCRLVTLPPMLPPPGSLYPGLPQSSLPSSVPYSFPYYKIILLLRFGSTVVAAISLCSRRGLSYGRFICRYIYLLSLSLSTDLPSTRTPRPRISGSPRDCLNP